MTRLQVEPRSKYGNRKTECDGILFDSAAEARYWRLLKFREAAGEIRAIERQFEIPLMVNGVLVARLYVDFRYEDVLTGVRRYDDVKGSTATITPVYRLKKKLAAAIWGITVHEVQA